jgi:hypothetical protein
LLFVGTILFSSRAISGPTPRVRGFISRVALQEGPKQFHLRLLLTRHWYQRTPRERILSHSEKTSISTNHSFSNLNTELADVESDGRVLVPEFADQAW